MCEIRKGAAVELTRMSAGCLDPEQVPISLVTPGDDVVERLFRPALTCSTEYKRAVGYFSSAWIARNAHGLAALASRGGVARWITSPHLSENDWAALSAEPESRNEVVERSLLGSIEDLEQALSSDTLNTLGWMVQDGLLKFRIAVSRSGNKASDFHSKFGIFLDGSEPFLAFIGSLNESNRALDNHEVLSLYHRDRPGELERVQLLDELFEAIWSNKDPAYEVFDLPEAARRRIVNIRTDDRPYVLNGTPTFRQVLRPYQSSALEAWILNGHQGILEMATGTGKTITALACVEHLLGRESAPNVILVACPFQHLVDQWAEQLSDLSLPIVCAHESASKWRPQLSQALATVRAGVKQAAVVVTTYTTLVSGTLASALRPFASSTIFVADECHYLGSRTARAGMMAEYPFRLGLSATPSRHYDEGGTQAILEYFNGVIYEFGLAKAIEGGYLVPYSYYPELVELTQEETLEFIRLSDQLARAMASNDGEPHEAAMRIAIKRARVLNNATQKIDWLREKLEAQSASSWEYTLIYAGDKIFQPVTELAGREQGVRIHEFTSRQSRRQRASILKRFAERDLQMLVAMKCLDEGVDVPPTRTAYFLASSGNPREFVQRRGRILRTAPGKSHAVIVDAVAVPAESLLAQAVGTSEWRAARSALRSQVSRISEFASLAENSVQAEAVVFDLSLRYDIPLVGTEDEVIDAF